MELENVGDGDDDAVMPFHHTHSPTTYTTHISTCSSGGKGKALNRGALVLSSTHTRLTPTYSGEKNVCIFVNVSLA